MTCYTASLKNQEINGRVEKPMARRKAKLRELLFEA
jgi:hypothetical protein